GRGDRGQSGRAAAHPRGCRRGAGGDEPGSDRRPGGGSGGSAWAAASPPLGALGARRLMAAERRSAGEHGHGREALVGVGLLVLVVVGVLALFYFLRPARGLPPEQRAGERGRQTA